MQGTLMRRKYDKEIWPDARSFPFCEMKSQKLTIQVSASLGSVSGELLANEAMSFFYVLAHGAGAGMNHPFMLNLSSSLAELGIGTLRYNFPYMEKGGKRPDAAAIAEKTVKGAIAVAHELFPGVPLLAGGKSFGGRMTSQALSRESHPAVRGIVFAGFPLHPPGSPGTARAEHLANVDIPMLFLQGTRDALAKINLVEEVCAGLKSCSLVKFEGADHSFRAGKQDIIPQLADAIRKWATALA